MYICTCWTRKGNQKKKEVEEWLSDSTVISETFEKIYIFFQFVNNFTQHDRKKSLKLFLYNFN